MSQIAAVVIGRNEGERLVRCLASLEGRAAPIVYVDSGSTDGSVAAAEAVGAEVVALDLSKPFTAARARNEGLRMLDVLNAPELVQMIDGDCELDPDWIDHATAFLEGHPRVAMVAGRLRERFPDASIWNKLADAEWDTPTGETDAVGGIVVLRRGVVQTVGGYRDDLIAGEEPELCLRLRRHGFQIWRLKNEMALHDIAMTQFRQWWKRMRRHGHAVAEGFQLHGRDQEKFCRTQIRRALLWGIVLPLVAILGAFLTPYALGLILLWPAQVVRLRLRHGSWVNAFFLTLGKLPEAQGILSYHFGRAGTGAYRKSTK